MFYIVIKVNLFRFSSNFFSCEKISSLPTFYHNSFFSLLQTIDKTRLGAMGQSSNGGKIDNQKPPSASPPL